MQGNLVLAVDVTPCRGNPDPVIRGKVKGFSKASRRRMIQQCAKMGKAIPIFVTLTYGAEYPEDPAEWKRHLENWGKRLKRLNSDLSAIWRLEPQKRGAPHFHLLIYQADGKKPFVSKEWIADSWSKVLGEYSSEEHLKAGTRVESLRSSRGAAFYVAKYCAKLPEEGDFPPEWDRAGRLWGCFNRKSLPEAKQHEMVLHSHLEQGAVLSAMKDAYKQSFVKGQVKRFMKDNPEDFDGAYNWAEKQWKKALSDNEHLGNTTTLYGDAETFLQGVSAKIGHFEMLVAGKGSKNVQLSNSQRFVDRIASVF